MVEGIELAQQEPAFDIVGLQLNDLGVLGERQLQYLLGGPLARHVAQRLQIDAAQQLMRFEVIGIVLKRGLRGHDGFADAACAQIEFREAAVQIL